MLAIAGGEVVCWMFSIVALLDSMCHTRGRMEVV